MYIFGIILNQIILSIAFALIALVGIFFISKIKYITNVIFELNSYNSKILINNL